MGGVTLPRAYGLWALSQAASRSTTERQTEGSQGASLRDDDPRGRPHGRAAPGSHRGPVHVRRCSCPALFNHGGECLPLLYSPEPDWNSCWVLLLLLLFLNHGFFCRQILHTNYFKKPLSQVCKKKAKCLSFGSLYSKETHTHTIKYMHNKIPPTCSLGMNWAQRLFNVKRRSLEVFLCISELFLEELHKG